jgi:hypothetical protein
VSGHETCDHAYKTVTCDRCKRPFTCTPWDDFYCAAEGDHCCERCLIGDAPLTLKLADDIAAGDAAGDVTAAITARKVTTAPHRVIVRVNLETNNWQACCTECEWQSGARDDMSAEELAAEHRNERCEDCGGLVAGDGSADGHDHCGRLPHRGPQRCGPDCSKISTEGPGSTSPEPGPSMRRVVEFDESDDDRGTPTRWVDAPDDEPPSISLEPGPEPLAEAPTLTEIVEFLDPDGKLRAESTKDGTE